MRHYQLHGILFRPGSDSQKGNEENMMSTMYSTSGDFIKKYSEHISAMEIVAECAKVYIENNWTKVKDWSNLNVIILDNTGKTTEYYKYDPTVREKTKIHEKCESITKIFDRINLKNKSKHNPVESITEVVLDHTDEDFSLIINGNDHMWIDDESVIIIAAYIENNIN